VQTNEMRYVYNGNLVIQERDANNVPQVSYTRGKDLSGSFEGAGGIGGLLARTDHSTFTPQSTGYYHSDGNGNVTALINTNQIVVARYEFDPFGNMVSLSGPLADVNLYRFSSKEFHLNSGLIYYLYRFYDPNLQRWQHRDPIAELGGINLYRFVENVPTRGIDAFGLRWWNWIPVLNLLNCFVTEPGEKTHDYHVPSPTCQECKGDSGPAIKRCRDAVNSQAGKYASPIAGDILVDFVEDGIIAAGGLAWKPIWLLLIPNGIATACSLKTFSNVRDASSQYADTVCVCPDCP
jgi:RHS repeat-associated protein